MQIHDAGEGGAGGRGGGGRKEYMTNDDCISDWRCEAWTISRAFRALFR